jgi:hypothetical protein
MFGECIHALYAGLHIEAHMLRLNTGTHTCIEYTGIRQENLQVYGHAQYARTVRTHSMYAQNVRF